ncbi:Yos1-like protein [Venturia nashicola]|uniref:Yos1-like protein n=1 Tax=Venturia nashicola TaxID=86259 RepID=A0A4Z1P6E1_9PEZI|nr:Yos1-like protein [Venturia nashicola]TLD24632.1 Yos1-like protein [Venturia nashicola]
MALLFSSFGLGSLFYVGVLLVNAIAVLSEDRFLARIKNSNLDNECADVGEDSADRHQYAGNNISVYIGLSVQNKEQQEYHDERRGHGAANRRAKGGKKDGYAT